VVSDMSKEGASRSLSTGSHSSPLSLDSTTSPPVSRSPGVEKLFQSAASSSHPLSLLTPSSLSKPMSTPQVSGSMGLGGLGGLGGSSMGMGGGGSNMGGGSSSGLSMPSLQRKTSTPSTDHKTMDPRSVWASFRVGAMFVRCIVHPVHVHYLLCQQTSSNEWQVIEMNQENRKKMIQGQPLKRSTYTFNEKHKIEVCSLGELNTLVPSVKPFGGRSGFGFGHQGGSDFEDIDDLPGFSEDLDLRMTLND